MPIDASRLKEALSSFISKTWYSNKMRTLFFFMVALLIVNFLLIWNEHYNIKPEGTVSDKIKHCMVNSTYLSSTQLTTMGYGDITPQTHFSKVIVSVIHFAVMVFAFNLAAEYGANNTMQDMVENSLNKMFRKNMRDFRMVDEDSKVYQAVIQDMGTDKIKFEKEDLPSVVDVKYRVNRVSSTVDNAIEKLSKKRRERNANSIVPDVDRASSIDPSIT